MLSLFERSWMPSLVWLLKQNELGARRRLDELRDEPYRVQAELAVAEREWNERAIARLRVDEAPTPADESEQDHARTDRTAQVAEERTGRTSPVPVPVAAEPKSQAPVWAGRGACSDGSWSGS
ncbi:hypothetical protein [Streptomyces sp. SID12488]|uniref:hypothetical protein n=1 Tax=Streptomyces sp. SID12488 TaxID=2706040 RepID=UPI0013DD4F6E|nr:hypothetical protein [Streptomyces sp. SID12488]NEA68537.1 hypothetical protein [Streptomyces sp. SID12488]